jgi:YVTN family beta-propeller protein
MCLENEVIFGCRTPCRGVTFGWSLVRGVVVVSGAAEGGGRGLCFAVLGPLQVTRSGERLSLGGHQQRAVLALLLAETGGVVSVGRLADALWGERTPGGFVATVQTYVFHLREALEPDRRHGAPGQVLVTERGGYSLDTTGSTVDAAIFESLLSAGQRAIDRGAYDDASAGLKRALDLWRGEVLADVADLRFFAPFAARLEEMRQTARGLRIEAELALGLHADALPEIDGLVAEHPLWEQLQALRITALYRSGRQSDALAAYRELRNRLGEELGIEPSSPLQQLHQAVLTQATALDWQGPKALEASLPDPGNGPDPPEWPTPAPLGSAEPSRPAIAPPSDRWVRIVTFGAAVLLAVGLATVIAFPFLRSSSPSFPGNSIGSINADGSLGEAIRVGQSPDGLAYADGALWATNSSDNTVSRIDPHTRAVQPISVGASPTALTTTGDDVWVANFDGGTVSRINVVTNTVVQTIPVGNQPAAIASRPDGVWVANSGDGTIQRIDPSTGLADKAVEVGGGPDGIAIDKTSLWVCNGVDGTVVEVDPKTSQLGAPVVVGGEPRGIALAQKYVWVASRLSQSVTRINRATGDAVTLSVGDGPNSVQVAGNAVWVSNEYDGTMTWIDQSSNEIHRLPPLGASPRGMTIDSGGRIWVASGAFADPAHRGGTLTVVANKLPGGRGADPSAISDSTTIMAERYVYDGLVALGLSGGAASQSLVPDLAQAIPQPSNGNKTYTFTLRPDIKYSTGQQVHASDFRKGVLKALTVGASPEYYASIAGGRGCIDHPASCDLSAGLKTDDAQGRVTFNLVAPDPVFLDKLAHFVYPVAPGGKGAVSLVPVPGTGPYMISAYVPNKKFTLSRNPFFRQRSVAAQPAGYPDVIGFRKVANGKAAADEVIDGRADVAWVYPGSTAVRDALAMRYPAQLKSQVLADTDFEYLNTRMAPFNDLRVRQALNYAVDRSRLIDILGSEARFLLTCQVLPPNFPSHRWHCPYTPGQEDGGYHGPDLARAQELVAASGTRGRAVTVQGARGRHLLNVYFEGVLRQLGYTVHLRELPDSFDFLGSRDKVQITLADGWIAEYPAASQLYDKVFACTTVSGGVGWYCNPQVEGTVAQARAVELTDPGQAAQLWTQVDQLITDDAPVVALGNLTASLLVSRRVGNYKSNPELGPLLSQIWVR